MDDYVLEAVLNSRHAATPAENVKLYRQADHDSDLSYLDKEKLRKAQRRQKLDDQRAKAYRLLQDKGLFAMRPSVLPNEDYHSQCLPAKPYVKKINPLMQPNPDKPQNCEPFAFTSCGSFGSEDQIFNQPYVSDRVVRAKERAKWCETINGPKRVIENNIFPQLAVQQTTRLTEDDEFVRRYLGSSVYQTTYTDPSPKRSEVCRQRCTAPTRPSLSNILKNVSGYTSHHPPAMCWQPEQFNGNTFDAAISRYPYINEPRPYEFCSHAPRIDQIPTYSGCHGTDEVHVDDDNPYIQYKPLNKVRREIPSHAFPYMSHHMPGYTGCTSELSRPAKRESEAGNMDAHSSSVKIAS